MAASHRRHSSPSPSSSSSSSPHRRKLTRSDRPVSSPVARRDSRVSSHRDRDMDRHRRYSSDDDSDPDRYNSKQPRRGGRSSDDARKREILPPPPPLPPPRRPDARVSPARDRRRGSDTDSETRGRGRVKEARDEGRRRSGDQDRKRPVPGPSAERKSRAVRSHSSDSGDVIGTAEDGSGGARKRESPPPPPPLPLRPDARVSPGRDRRRGSGKDTDLEARARSRADITKDIYGSGSADVIGTAERRKLQQETDRQRREGYETSDDDDVGDRVRGNRDRQTGRSHGSSPDARKRDREGRSEGRNGRQGTRVKDTWKEEILPPMPSLPPPPPMLNARAERDSRVSVGEERRYPRREGRCSSGEDSDSDIREHRRGLQEERGKRRRYSDESSDDEDHRRNNQDRLRDNRDRKTARNRRTDNDSSRNGVGDAMPPMPSLPPPPPMLNARAERDSRVSVGEETRYPRREGRRNSGKVSDSEGERGRGLQEERGKRWRYSDGSSDDEDHRRDNRDKKAASNRRSDNDSSRNGVRDVDGANKREAVKDTRKEEFLPPPPPRPSLPPPPPLPIASAVRDSRVVLGNERRNGDGERRRGGRIGSDEDSDSEGHVRGKISKEERRKRDSSDEDSDSEGHVRGGRSKERRKRHNSDEDSDSESHDRRKRSKESHKRQRHKHSDGSSEDDDRRREKHDRKRERNRRSHDDNGERGQRNGRHSSPRRRKQDRDSRNGDQDPRKREPSPPLPPLPPMPDALAGRTGGIYIPPFRMAQMMREVEDKSSEAYQRLSWDALRKSINGLVNKVNATNIKNIIPELLSENLIRGRGLFCRSCMKSQMASPGFTDVFSALVAVVNTKFPDLGKLLLKRIVLQLKRAYKRNDKPQLLAATKFIAHLVNQQVAHEIIALELLTLLLENPTDDSVEVAVGFVKECGAVLQDLSPKGLYGIFERFRGILHEAELDKRVRYLIEDLFGVRKAKFEGYPAVRPELDLVELEDQFIHEISLEDDDVDPETNLDVFKLNPQFLDDEKAYENLKRNMLGDEPSEEDGSDEAPEDEDEELSEEDEEEKQEIKDETETNLVNLRRTIYLTIMSSVDFEEAGHKLLKIKLEPGQEMELCIMLLECCSQERTYLRYYGLLGQRFCMINRVHQENFETCFVQQYSMIHRLETNKLRNVAKFFAHLLGTSALPWHVLSYIRLTEEDTTSSSRIFIKILFQELSEHLGIRLLNERLNDPTMQDSFESIFPKDNPKNTRFSINFFTSIGLGGITENLREYLKNMPRLIMQQQKPVSDSDKSGSSDDSSSGSESESDSDSDSSSDESERRRRKRRRK